MKVFLHTLRSRRTTWEPLRAPPAMPRQTFCTFSGGQVPIVRYDSAGVKVVLTSPRGAMSRYNGDPFGAFIAVFPEKVITRMILRPGGVARVDNPDDSANVLPSG